MNEEEAIAITEEDELKTYIELGHISISKILMSHLCEYGINIIPFLIKHSESDFGKISDENRIANEIAIEINQGMILSCYGLEDGKEILIITEFKPLRTQAMFLSEYFNR